MFLLSMLISVSSHAAMTNEFACYQAMNEKARTKNLIMDGKVAIHPIDVYSFYKVTAEGIQKCRVPTSAPLAPDGKEGAGPWLMKFVYQKEHYHIQYPQAEEHIHIKGAPPWVTPECTASPSGVAKILENRIADSRQACKEGHEFATCLRNFLDRLNACTGIPVISAYVDGLARTSVHAEPSKTPAPASPAETGR